MAENYIVKNRSTSFVTYRLPEEGIRREFMPGEEKKIPMEELTKLSYQSGGRELMQDFLQIKDDTVIEELGIQHEPEYDMNEDQVADLILNGSIDAFLDCLEFAPTGVIDLIKILSVNLPMTDYDKRKALKNKTGFDVDTALRNAEAEQADSEKTEPTAPTRRVKKEETPSGRRTETPNYKIVHKD